MNRSRFTISDNSSADGKRKKQENKENIFERRKIIDARAIVVAMQIVFESLFSSFQANTLLCDITVMANVKMNRLTFIFAYFSSLLISVSFTENHTVVIRDFDSISRHRAMIMFSIVLTCRRIVNFRFNSNRR